MLLQNKKAYRYADFDHMRSLFNFFRKGGGLVDNPQPPLFVHDTHSTISDKETFSSRFSSNSETLASGLLEHHEEMLPRYCHEEMLPRYYHE